MMSSQVKQPLLRDPRRPDWKRRNSSEGSPGNSGGGRSSPEVNCAICLGKIEDKALADKCFHSFCKTCLVEWSKVKAECPVCRQSFTKIIHNVKAIDNYEELRVESRVDSSFSVWTNMDGVPRLLFPSTSSFRYPTTLTPLRRSVLEFQRLVQSHQPQQSAQPSIHRLAVVISSPGQRTSIRRTTHTHVEEVINIANEDENEVFPPPKATSAFRRYIYTSDLWVLPFGNGDKSRYRESSATFYQANPACTHRLFPWLNREFVAILDNPYECDIILPIVKRSILQCNIVSVEFRRIIEPYIGQRTDHFIHEFYNFAKSVYDMEAYSRIAIYVPKQRAEIVKVSTVPHPVGFPQEIPSSSSSDSDTEGSSDSIIVVDSPQRSPARSIKSPSSRSSSRETDQEIEDAIGSVDFTVAQNVDPINGDFRLSIIDDFENPQPGPSGLSSSRSFKCIKESDDESDIDVGKNIPYTPTWNPFANPDDENSDCSVEIVGVRKPLHERTPELIELSSDEVYSEKDDQKAKVSKGKHLAKKHKHKHKSHKRYRSRSPSPRGHRRPKYKHTKRRRDQNRSRSRDRSQMRSRSRSPSESRSRNQSRSSNGSFSSVSVVESKHVPDEKLNQDSIGSQKRYIPSVVVQPNNLGGGLNGSHPSSDSK